MVPCWHREHGSLPCEADTAANPRSLKVVEEASDTVLLHLHLLTDCIQLHQDDRLVHLHNLKSQLMILISKFDCLGHNKSK